MTVAELAPAEVAPPAAPVLLAEAAAAKLTRLQRRPSVGLALAEAAAEGEERLSRRCRGRWAAGQCGEPGPRPPPGPRCRRRRMSRPPGHGLQRLMLVAAVAPT